MGATPHIDETHGTKSTTQFIRSEMLVAVPTDGVLVDDLGEPSRHGSTLGEVVHHQPSTGFEDPPRLGVGQLPLIGWYVVGAEREQDRVERPLP